MAFDIERRRYAIGKKSVIRTLNECTVNVQNMSEEECQRFGEDLQDLLGAHEDQNYNINMLEDRGSAWTGKGKHGGVAIVLKHVIPEYFSLNRR